MQWRRMIGYVPQEVMLFNDSIFNNVTLRESGFSEADVVAALRAAGAMSFVNEYKEGVHYSVGERGHRLSGGQRQRIAIARALVRNPTLLILDEATAGLDKKTELEISNSIVDIARSRELTVVTISHNPIWSTVADEVYLVSEGGPSEGAQVRLLDVKDGAGEPPHVDLPPSRTRVGMPH
jgi:ATP-binding cassette subfamily C protein